MLSLKSIEIEAKIKAREKFESAGHNPISSAFLVEGMEAVIDAVGIISRPKSDCHRVTNLYISPDNKLVVEYEI